MKYILPLLYLIVLPMFAQQDYNANSFQVTKADIENREFPNDSMARALVIYEKGNSYVSNSNFRLRTEIQRKVKILNRNGFDKGTVSIFIYKPQKGNREKIENINATVYNMENGKVVKTSLDKSAVFEENYNKNYNVIKFALPNVQVGSVITYSYTAESPYMFKYKGWYFQDDIPKLYSEYNASIPGNWEYNIKLVGGKQLNTNVSSIDKNCLQTSSGANSSCGVYKYIMKDIPAFINEDFMTTRLNYLARIEYELAVFRGFDGTLDNITETWKTTDNEIKRDSDLGKQLRRFNLVKNLLDNDIISEPNTLTKAENILRYVQDNYTWNTQYDVLNNLSVKSLIDKKSGNVGEINALLFNLLTTNNIDAKPILLSTRANGFITQLFPVISDFNYIIVKVTIDDKDYLLDATDKYLTFGQLPFRCLNSYGRLLNPKKESSWYPITVKDYSVKRYSYNLNFKDDILTGEVNYFSKGYHALNDRKRYFTNPETYTNDFENSYEDIMFLDFKTVNTQKMSKDFKLKFNINKSPDIVGNTIYMNPIIFNFFDKNPFQLQQRSYPIDFGYKDNYSYNIKINVDENYIIKSIPKKLSISLPNNKGSLVFSSDQNDNSITLYFKLTFKEAIYEPEYYDSLKKLLTQVIETQNNSLIVLEKKQ